MLPFPFAKCPENVLFYAMSNSIHRLFFLPLVLFSVSSSLFQTKCLVAGSSVHHRSFKRPDPLRQFKDYNGDFDVGNKHYLASTAFTGVHGYAVGGIWLLCGLLFGFFIFVKRLSGGSASLPFKDCLDPYYLLLFLLVLLLTSAAIVASGFGLATSQKVLRRAVKLKDSVVSAGEDAYVSLSKVIRNMKQMQSLLLPYDPKISESLNSTIDNLRTDSRVIRRFIDRTDDSIDKPVHISYIVHVITVSINLVMLIAALVLLLLHWRPGFIIIIFCCWILTSMFWVLTGFDFFLNTFAADACFAFEDFEQNPKNSSLGSMLPCMNDTSSSKLIADIGLRIHTFISMLNSNMSGIYRLLGVDKESEKSIGDVKICDPFPKAPDYSYNPESCPQDTIWVSDLPKIFGRFLCHEKDSAEECKKHGKFLPETAYDMARAYSRSVQDLLDIYPDLQSLSKCTFVKNKVSDILLHQCKPLRASTKMLWSFMLALSMIMVVLVLVWLAEAFLSWGKYIFPWTNTA